MNQSQRAAAERLADDLQRFDGAERESLRDEAAALLRELLAEPVINQQMTTELAEPVQEPVGWLHDETGDFEPSHKPWMDDDEEWVPLYAAPQQPMRCPTDGGECGAGGYCRPEQRKPLTRDELLSLWKQHGYKSAMCEPFVRAVEEAHGITGEPT